MEKTYLALELFRRTAGTAVNSTINRKISSDQLVLVRLSLLSSQISQNRRHSIYFSNTLSSTLYKYIDSEVSYSYPFTCTTIYSFRNG